MRRGLRRLVAGAAVLGMAGAVMASSAIPVGAGAGETMGYVITVEDGESPSCRLEQLDLASGALTPIGDGARSLDRCVWDLAFNPGGTQLYGLRWEPGDPTTVSLITYDLVTGVATAVGQVGTFPAALGNASQVFNGGGLAFDNDGTLYVSMRADNVDAPQAECQDMDASFCTYTVDPADPSAVTLLGLTAEASGALTFPIPSAFAVACSGGFTGSQQTDPDGASLTTIDRTSGLGTPVGPHGTTLSGMDYDGTGTLWGIGNPDLAALYTVDPATGAATFAADIPGAFVGSLAIVHVCAAPTPPAPIPVQPVTFTG